MIDRILKEIQGVYHEMETTNINNYGLKLHIYTSWKKRLNEACKALEEYLKNELVQSDSISDSSEE